ncbi:1490_t:CDS:10 [Paraglomus occultum]|uniref:1490_t:CDS:1 n=1 Tax=Paraglomus occultum TaxID=144539 RepID=A0A9N9G7Y4_9GLOM|nr:1490_t:CDS:10 [Paraglomus occultum]
MSEQATGKPTPSKTRKTPLVGSSDIRVPLKVNTSITHINGIPHPMAASPSFRRTMAPGARQSWIIDKHPPVSETESVVQPTPILGIVNNSAKSRLSILVQNGSQFRGITSISSSRLAEREREADDTTALVDEKVETNELDISDKVEETEETTSTSTMVQSPASATSLLSSTQYYYMNNVTEGKPMSETLISPSSSMPSTLLGASTRGSLYSDSVSIFSSSPSIKTQNETNTYTHKESHNRHSMPIPSSDTQRSTTFCRRASMPILSSMKSTNEYGPKDNTDDNSNDITKAYSSNHQNDNQPSPAITSPSIISPTMTSPSIASPSIDTNYIDLNVDDEDDDDFEENETVEELLQRYSNNGAQRPGSMVSTFSTNTNASTDTAVSSASSSMTDTTHARLSTHAIYSGRLSVRLSRISATTPAQKRQSIALEILTTERHYVECLQLLERLFLRPLVDSLKTTYPILSESCIKGIFSNLKELINVNTELLRELEERIAGIGEKRSSGLNLWSEEDACVGDIFLNLGPFLKMYSIYVNNFNSALALIDEQLKSNPAFAAFLRDIIKTGQCKGLTFQAYLIMPVQRIPRYKLLLEDLLKKTEESHPDYLSLKKAYQVIEHVATFVNETIRQHEMFITMLEIQKTLSGFDEALLVPGRRFIKRGTVNKECRRRHQEREFFLFSDILIYASPALLDDMYNFHRKFDLEDVTVLPVDKSKGNSQECLSNYQSTEELYGVYKSSIITASQREKESWIEAIREAKEEYLSAKRTLKIADKNVPIQRKDLYKKRVVENYNAPVWVPDSATNKCMNCPEEFTMFRRKHHCRACGKVVCHACSTRNFIIPGTSERDDQVVRACDPCFFTMFPDALQDEDLAPGVQVWNPVSLSNSSTTSVNVVPDNAAHKRSISNGDNSIGSMLNPFKTVHEAIVARTCELCKIDFNVFRWRNTCFKFCTDCLTKKPIDLTLLPKEFLLEFLAEQQNFFGNRRDSIFGTAARLCDVCFLGIDPTHVEVNESGGGWTVRGQLSPPLTPPPIELEEKND